MALYGRRAWHARQQHATVLELEQAGAHIDHTAFPHELSTWKLRLLGYDFLTGIEGVLISGANGNGVEGLDEMIELSSRLHPLDRIRIENVTLTEDSLLPLKKKPKLKWLSLFETNATDQHLQILEMLPNLRVLDLRGTDITDESVDVLSSLKQLEYLGLQDSQMSEAADNG